MTTPTTRVIKARRPEDVLATVPYLVGFHPRDSLVVLVLAGPRDRVVFSVRVDLPGENCSPQRWAETVVTTLRRNGADRVLVVAFSDRETLADPAVDALSDALSGEGIDIVDAWRADGHRWWSYRCTDPSCCPATGTPYDASAGPCAVQAVVNGLVALPDRDALADGVSRLSGPTELVMEDATERIQDEILAAVLASPDPVRALVVQGQDEVAAFVRGFVQHPRRVTEEEAARLTVWMQHVHVRDAAWCLMDPRELDPHIDLWRQVTRLAVPGLVAAPAALLSFAAWRSGRGSLARCALERVLTDDPGYSMGALLSQVLDDGLPPSSWDPMPLAQLYAATRGSMGSDEGGRR